jgi:hypothetical protein
VFNLIKSSQIKNISSSALLQEDDVKNEKAAFLAKLATLKTIPSEDEAPCEPSIYLFKNIYFTFI